MEEKILILKEASENVLIPYKELYSYYTKIFNDESESIFVFICKINYYSRLRIVHICRKNVNNENEFILIEKEIYLLIDNIFNEEPKVDIYPDKNDIYISYFFNEISQTLYVPYLKKYEKTMAPIYIL